jgi:hypothetical protein
MILYRKMLGLMWEKLDAWTDVGGKTENFHAKEMKLERSYIWTWKNKGTLGKEETFEQKC